MSEEKEIHESLDAVETLLNSESSKELGKMLLVHEDYIKSVGAFPGTLARFNELKKRIASKSEELIFASKNEALQHLANLTGKRIKVASDRIPGNAPADVKKVAKAWIDNAIEAAKYDIKEGVEDAEGTMKFWKERIYVYENKKGDKNAWIIADNYDKGPAMFYYPDTQEWYYQESYGEASLMKGGTNEALANAQIMWTG